MFQTAKLTPAESYWLGFYFADGSVSDAGLVSLELSELDRDHVLAAAEFWGLPKNKVRVRPGRIRNGYRCLPTNVLQFQDKDLVVRLSGVGLVPRKTKEARFIGDWGSLDEASFWRGVWDGDGAVGVKGRCGIRMTLTGSKEMLEDFVSWVRRVAPGHSGGVVEHYHPRSSNPQYDVYLGTQTSLSVLREFYLEEGPWLERKRRKALTIIDNALQRERFRPGVRDVFEKTARQLSAYGP